VPRPNSTLDLAVRDAPIWADVDRTEVKKLRAVVASVLYVLVRRTLSLPTLRFRSDGSKDLEMRDWYGFWHPTSHRPHRCLSLLAPEGRSEAAWLGRQIERRDRLGGLIHRYHWAA
jgi:hypothetical protein